MFLQGVIVAQTNPSKFLRKSFNALYVLLPVFTLLIFKIELAKIWKFLKYPYLVYTNITQGLKKAPSKYTSYVSEPNIRLISVVFKDVEESLMIFGESSKIVVDSPKILVESMTSLKDLWPQAHEGEARQGHGCSHCHIRVHAPGSRSANPRHSLRQSCSSPSSCT